MFDRRYRAGMWRRRWAPAVEPATDDVIVRLTHDEALVHFEWLSWLADDDVPVTDPAEREALCGLSGALDKTLVAPFQSDYAVQLAAARDRLRSAQDDE